MAPVIVNEKNVRAFATEAAFEAWLSKHHASEAEVWLRIYKKGSGVPTVSTAQALDVVLCWGWIDGIRKSLDETSFLQRYTPRRSRSVWSQINRDHVARLVAAGRMTPHGQAQVDRAKADGRWDAAYASMRNSSIDTLPPDLRAAIAENPAAAAAVEKLGRGNLFALTFRLSTVKTAAGRTRKIAELVSQLARGVTILPEPGLAQGGESKARTTRAIATETRVTETRVTEARVTKTVMTKPRAARAVVTETRAARAVVVEARSAKAGGTKATAAKAGATKTAGRRAHAAATRSATVVVRKANTAGSRGKARGTAASSRKKT